MLVLMCNRIISLFQPDGSTKIDPETLVADLKEMPWNAMVVNVEELPIPAPIVRKLVSFGAQWADNRQYRWADNRHFNIENM
jgi:hypothetical protein